MEIDIYIRINSSSASNHIWLEINIYIETNVSSARNRVGVEINIYNEINASITYASRIQDAVQPMKIFSDEILGELGEVIKADKKGLHLQTKNGVLSLLDVQLEGKKRMDYMSFINGHPNLLHELLQWK